MCDRKQSDELRGHKDQGMHQDIGDLTKMFDKNDKMRQGHHEMEGNIHGLRMDQSGDSAEQKKLNKERMQGFSDKKEECDGKKKCGGGMKDECH